MATANQKVVRQRARALRRTANVIFTETIEEADEGPLFSLAETINSNSRAEDIDWITDFAQVSAWDGERETSDFRAYGFTIEPKHFEVTMKIDANDLADERLSMYTRRITQRANAFARHRREMIAERLASAFDANPEYTAYDGKSLIADDHPIYRQKGDSEDAWVEEGTLSNFPATSTTNFKLAPNYKTAKAMKKVVYPQMREFRGDNGVRIGVNPDTVVVPDAMQFEADEVFGADMIMDEQIGELRPNPASGQIDRIIAEPELDQRGFDEGFFLFDSTSPVLMPFIYLLRQGIQQDSLTENSERAFMRNEFLYGADARYDVHMGHYQAVLGSDGSDGAL